MLEVIKENRIFRRLYSRGKYQVHPILVTYVQKNREGRTRYGISASKKTGGAVERNRAKRVIRAAFWELEKRLPEMAGWDFIFVARSRTSKVKMDEVKKVMEHQVRALTAGGGKGGREKQREAVPPAEKQKE